MAALPSAANRWPAHRTGRSIALQKGTKPSGFDGAKEPPVGHAGNYVSPPLEAPDFPGGPPEAKPFR